MKKIINGKLYDTETARELGFAAGGDGFGSWEERLYIKRTHEFFIHGAGGPATKYAKFVEGNNVWSNGERIVPLTYAKAREWAEEHLGADEYAKIFGLPDEDAEPMILTAQIPAQLMARLRARAADDGTSVTATVIEILTAAL